MPTVRASATVNATPQEAFDFVADYRNLPFLQPHFTSARLVSEQERGLGATVALAGRFHGVPIHVENKIITFAPPDRLVSISQGAILSRSVWEFRQLTGTPPLSHVSLVIDFNLRNVMGGLFMGMGSAFVPFFHREIQRMTDDSLRRLQSIFPDRVEVKE